MALSPMLIVLITVGELLLLVAIVAVIYVIIKKKYSLNWYQKATLEDNDLVKDADTLKIVRHKISRRKLSSYSSSGDEEAGEDNSALLPDDTAAAPPTFLDKLSKRVGFIQPPISEPRSVGRSMGAEESKPSSIKPILKHQLSDSGTSCRGSRRFSAPVVYGKGTEFSKVYRPSTLTIPEDGHGHTKLSATRSAPYGAPIAELDEKTFTLPIAVDEMCSAGAKARLARRRTSMQDSIDATSFDPSLYSQLERTPTIKEEASVDINEPIGILELTVCLMVDTGLLRVTIHKADFTGFPTSQIQLRNPYFSTSVTGSPSPIRHTRHSEDDQHPVIEETFLFEVGDDLSDKRLVCQLYDFDQFVKTEKLGIVQLRLTSLPANEPLNLQRHIDRCHLEEHIHDENYVGELLFSIKCHKTKDSVTVTLFMSKAKDLHIEDEIAVLGLMVKATVLERGRRHKKKRTTDNVKLSTSPMFNQEIVITVIPPLPIQDLSVMVDVCKVRLSSPEVIGRVHICPEGNAREVEHWKEFQQSVSHEAKSLEWWHQLKRVDKGS